ncbi:hypothetical protein MMC29_005966 [Sticta canariensis]|nr:hypothetical protein [Sticta canariensis]
MDPGTLLVAEQVVSTTVEGAALASIGLAQSTQPLSATFTRITSEAFLPRSSHTLTVVEGRAYIFGGKNEKGVLAGNEVHIVTLPLETRIDGEPDYKCVPALGENEAVQAVPQPRSGHSACVIGERIYVLGGQGSGADALDEKGRIWVFDTNSLHWSSLDPKEEYYPSPRIYAGCAASEHPLPPGSDGKLKALGAQIQQTINKTVPSIVKKPSPPAEPHGTLFVSGGLFSTSSEPFSDSWAFSIASQTWTKLSSTPASRLPSLPSLALAQNRLYIISSSSEVESEIHHLSLPRSLLLRSDSKNETDESELPSSWQTVPFPTNPIAPGPRPRQGAGLLPITTGNGRVYLLYFLGEKLSTLADTTSQEDEAPIFWSDAFSYQLPASVVSPAGVKDSTRSTLGVDTGGGTWAEVKVIANEEGRGKSEEEGKSHPGPRGWFGSDRIGGAEVVLWGGIDGRGQTEGDGWIISIK